MKIKKKILNIVLSLVLAIPMIGVSIINSQALGQVSLKKTDGKDGLSGAMFHVYNSSGTDLGTFITDGNGKPTSIGGSRLTIDQNNNIVLDNGNYTLVEVTEPDGHILNPKPISFKIENGQITLNDIVNYKLNENESSINVRSVDMKAKGLADSEIKLLRKNTSTGKYELVGTMISDNTGFIKTFYETNLNNNVKAKLVNGVVVLPTQEGIAIQEEKSPDGYKLNSDLFNITLTPKKSVPQIIYHNQEIVDNDTNPGDSIIPSKDSGLMLRARYKDGRGLDSVPIEVYQVFGKSSRPIFKGKTIKPYGYLSQSSVEYGRALLDSNGTLKLPPGEYKYRAADGLQKKFVYVTVPKKGIKYEEIILDKKSVDAYNKINNKKINNTTNNTNRTRNYTNNNKRLAKTGSENSIAYTLSGLTLLVSGAFIFIKK